MISGRAFDHAGKAGGLFGAMGAQMNLDEPLNMQPELQRVQPGGVPCDITLGLKPLTAATRLTGRQVQHLAQLLRRQMRVPFAKLQAIRVSI